MRYPPLLHRVLSCSACLLVACIEFTPKDASRDASTPDAGPRLQFDAGPDSSVAGCTGDSCDGGVPVECRAADALDVLFVLDNSISMEANRLALAGQAQDLFRGLEGGDIDGDGITDFYGFASVHIGIVTSNIGLPRTY
jgi:hypothetical protein